MPYCSFNVLGTLYMPNQGSRKQGSADCTRHNVTHLPLHVR